ncbi:MAG: glycerophosphodiester phosphodiesterase family protein [Candidatus Midichloria sp.]|nr:hypothetical protein MHYMCMPSP_00403 [Hyalomma marginatum]
MKYWVQNSRLITFLFIILSSFNAEATKIFATAGGGGHFPENTMYAFEGSINGKVDGIEMDVQLTKDGVVVLYNSSDLSVHTNGKGAVKSFTYRELQRLDAAYYFDPQGNKSYPQRGLGHKIPTLDSILKKFSNTEAIIDFKSFPAKELVDATAKVVEDNKAWNRVIFHSIHHEHLKHLLDVYPTKAKIFEHRAKTLERLLRKRNEGICIAGDEKAQFVGFKSQIEMTVTTPSRIDINDNKIKFKLWDKEAVKCLSRGTKIFIFGVNNQEDYESAKFMGVYAVSSSIPLSLKR